LVAVSVLLSLQRLSFVYGSKSFKTICGIAIFPVPHLGGVTIDTWDDCPSRLLASVIGEVDIMTVVATVVASFVPVGTGLVDPNCGIGTH